MNQRVPWMVFSVPFNLKMNSLKTIAAFKFINQMCQIKSTFLTLTFKALHDLIPAISYISFVIYGFKKNV